MVVLFVLVVLVLVVAFWWCVIVDNTVCASVCLSVNFYGLTDMCCLN